LLRPDQRRALAANPAKIPLAVEEMLRWVTPIQNMARTATRAVELRGQRIEEGQKLLLLYPSANRDASVFRDPFTFDIQRTPNEHIAFGFGTHFCLGASLARLELRVFFEEVLPACRIWSWRAQRRHGIAPPTSSAASSRCRCLWQSELEGLPGGRRPWFSDAGGRRQARRLQPETCHERKRLTVAERAFVRHRCDARLAFRHGRNTWN
jgi:hypothetical protein